MTSSTLDRWSSAGWNPDIKSCFLSSCFRLLLGRDSYFCRASNESIDDGPLLLIHADWVKMQATGQSPPCDGTKINGYSHWSHINTIRQRCDTQSEESSNGYMVRLLCLRHFYIHGKLIHPSEVCHSRTRRHLLRYLDVAIQAKNWHRSCLQI